MTRIWRVLWEPARVFGEVDERPAWVAAVVGIMLLSLAVALLTLPYVNTVIYRQFGSLEGISPAQMATRIRAAQIGAMVGGVLGGVVPAALEALLLSLLGVLLGGAGRDYRRVLEVVLLASVPSYLGGLLRGVLFRFGGFASPLDVATSASLLLPASARGTWLDLSLQWIDPFILWSLGLLVYGYVRLGKGAAWRNGVVSGAVGVLFVALQFAAQQRAGIG